MDKNKMEYEKPSVEKLTKMNSPIEIIQAGGKRVVCRQCSSCHTCR